MKSSILTWLIRLVTATLCCVVVAATGASPSHAAATHDRTDSSCKVSTISFNKGYGAYWAASGVGAVAWRVSANLRVYDQCDHGGIVGTIGIYSANVKYKGGKVGMTNFLYADSARNVWRRDGVSVVPTFNANGWDNYNVNIAGHVDLSPTTWIRYLRINTALSFYGVPGAGRTITCTKSSPIYRGYAC